MTEPRRIGDLLAETLAAIRAAGPVLTQLDVAPTLYSVLSAEHFAQVANLMGHDLRPWLRVPVYADRSLPPWSRREHYSDGRVVTRYRLVLDPRVLQVSFRDQEYGLKADRGERHGLALMVKRFGWDYADVDARGCFWKGARSCPYVPGLKALTDMAARWLKDYGAGAGSIDWTPPRGHGLGSVNGI